MIDRTAVAHALSLAPVAMLVVAGDGRILALNPEMEGLFGYAPGELVGQPVEVLVPQAIRGAHAAHVAAFRRGPSKRAMGNGRELVGVRKNGEDMPLHLGLNAIMIDEQSCTVVSAVDISAPLAYRLSHDVPRDAPETAMIMIDQTGAIVLVNEAALVLTGYGRGELLDQPIEMLIPQPLWGRHVPLRDGYVADGKSEDYI